LGYSFEDHERGIEYFWKCDNCGVLFPMAVNSLDIPLISDTMRKEGWFWKDWTKENNYKSERYCPKCAVALGYIKGEGAKNEC
jgi:ribosomal protein S26